MSALQQRGKHMTGERRPPAPARRTPPFPLACDPHSIPSVLPPVRLSMYPRAALLLFALLSSVMLGSAQSASCEMHGLGAAQGISLDAAMADHAGMAVMSHDGSHTAGGDADSHCCCTCIGDCTMLAPLATAPTATTIRVALATPEPR